MHRQLDAARGGEEVRVDKAALLDAVVAALATAIELFANFFVGEKFVYTIMAAIPFCLVAGAAVGFVFYCASFFIRRLRDG